MADVIAGNPYTPLFPVTDSNGSPVTSGVTATLSLYYANGTSATATLAAQALTHFGNGRWGFTIAGSYLTSAGLYYVRTSTIVFGSTTLQAQELAFTVGTYNPQHLTLRGIITGVYRRLGGLLSGTSTGGSFTTLVDSKRIDSGLSSNEFVGRELLILEPPSLTDPNPVEVTVFSPASGTFTVPTLGTTLASGMDYLLLPQRVPYEDVYEAVLAAVSRQMPVQEVTDEISLTTDGTYELAVPASWQQVSGVAIDRTNSTPRRWEGIAPRYALWEPGRRKVRFAHFFASGYPVRISGTIACAEPRALTSVVQVNSEQIINEVVGQFQIGRGERDAGSLNLQRARSQRSRW